MAGSTCSDRMSKNEPENAFRPYERKAFCLSIAHKGFFSAYANASKDGSGGAGNGSAALHGAAWVSAECRALEAYVSAFHDGLIRMARQGAVCVRRGLSSIGHEDFWVAAGYKFKVTSFYKYCLA